MVVELFEHDLPDKLLDYFSSQEFLGIDTETTSLSPLQGKLTLCQVSDATGETISLVQRPTNESKNIISLMQNNQVMKIFHYARFDLGFIKQHLQCEVNNFFCTRILSKVVMPDESAKLKDLLLRFFNVELDKSLRLSFGAGNPDWNGVLSEEQKQYASLDVKYLFDLKQELEKLATLQQLQIINQALERTKEIVDVDLRGVVPSTDFAGITNLLGH